MTWMLMPNKYIGVYHRKQLSTPSYSLLATSLMDFECHPCGIFEGLEQSQ